MTRPILEIVDQATADFDPAYRDKETWKRYIEKAAPGYLELEDEADYDHAKFWIQ